MGVTATSIDRTCSGICHPELVEGRDEVRSLKAEQCSTSRPSTTALTRLRSGRQIGRPPLREPQNAMAVGRTLEMSGRLLGANSFVCGRLE